MDRDEIYYGFGAERFVAALRASPSARSYNSGHTVRACVLTKMLSYASHFVYPQLLGKIACADERRQE